VSLIITVAGVYNYHFNLNWLKVVTHCVPVIYIELTEGGVAMQTTGCVYTHGLPQLLSNGRCIRRRKERVKDLLEVSELEHIL